MKINLTTQENLSGRLAIIALLFFLGWSCSTSKVIPDRLLGVDLIDLEALLVKELDRGKDGKTYLLAEVFFLQGKYLDAYDHYQRADVLGQLTTDHHRRNYVHAGKVLGYSTPYDGDTGYFDRGMKFPVRINPFCGNSRNEDIVPYQWGEYLFVTSSRQATGESYPVTGKPFLNVVAFVENCQPISLPGALPVELNTDLHDGPLAISDDGSIVVINRNYRKSNKDDYRHLYFDYYVKDSSGRWGEGIRFPYCDVDYSVQHPFFNDSEQTLYYSSDKPGGFGGFDLYRSKWEGDGWGQPENLGADINTVYDEVFPVSTRDGYLMYSSNHPETYGGLDFVLYKDGKRMLFPAPLNTVHDDFGLTFSNETSGYFSSTRDRGPFADNIFQFTTYDPACKDYLVKVRDKFTGEPLEGVIVRYNAIEMSRRDQLVTLEGGRSMMFCHPEELKWPVDFQAEKQGYRSLSVSRGFEYLPGEGVYLAILELEGPVELFAEPQPHLASGNIVVYFENDIPRPAPVIPSYDLTYNRYVGVRNEYLRGSINPRHEMDRFFAEVDLGMSSLHEFASYVHENIGDNRLEIYLRGHASPRSNPVYNAALSERRNQSIKNYLMAWEGGKLAPFFASGHVKVDAIHFGDTQAPAGVSGSLEDRARSVYSVEASRERRVTLFWHWTKPMGETSQIPKSIQEITTLKEEPLVAEPKPAEVVDQKMIPKKGIYIIVGSFPSFAPANNLLSTLNKRGYSQAGLLLSGDGKNNRVFVESFKTREEAVRNLRKYRNEIARDAWILIE